MNTPTNDRRDYRLALGLLAGTAIGAGLVMWLAPRTRTELRARLTDSVKDLGQRASRTGQDVRDDVADVVARGAHEVARGARGVARSANDVEAFAVAAKSDRS